MMRTDTDCRERIRVQFCSDVEIVFLLFNSGMEHGSFSDIGAHQDFEMPEFVRRQLLIKELWLLLPALDRESIDY